MFPCHYSAEKSWVLAGQQFLNRNSLLTELSHVVATVGGVIFGATTKGSGPGKPAALEHEAFCWFE